MGMPTVPLALRKMREGGEPLRIDPRPVGQKKAKGDASAYDQNG